jgi:hypothetical protein
MRLGDERLEFDAEQLRRRAAEQLAGPALPVL